MTNKKCLMIFTLLMLALMIIPMSSASDLSSINQTSIDTLAISDDNLVAIDDSSDVLTDGENNIYVAKNGSKNGLDKVTKNAMIYNSLLFCKKHETLKP